MRAKYSMKLLVGIVMLQTAIVVPSHGSSLQLVSIPDSKLDPLPGASGDSYLPVISRDGRFVLFGSTADNLVPGTNCTVPPQLPSPLNVFLRDRTNGSTILVSVNLNGNAGGNGDSLPMGISTNGRLALFESKASNLVSGDTNNSSDIFMRDIQAGITTLVSGGTNGTFGDGGSYSSVMTPDGRYVAFTSAADNLVPGDVNGIPDVFVRDMASNITTLVSVDAQPVAFPYREISDTPVITPDGRYIAFYSTAANLAPGVGTAADVYVRDQKLGTTTWASVGALPALQSLASVSNSIAFNHALSDDGRFVAFEAADYSGPISKPAVALILRYDTQTGQTDIVETNAAVPVTSSYETIQNLSLTADGRFVAYVANALNASGTTTAIRAWDAQSNRSTLVSGDTNNSVVQFSLADSPVITPDGRSVAFLYSVPSVDTNENPTGFHVYLRDLQTQTNTLVDADSTNAGFYIDPGITPGISQDARVVAFQRQEGVLGPLNGKNTYAVLARDLGSTAVDLISVHDPGLPSLTAYGSSAVSLFSVSSNAQFIAFWSEADDVVDNDTNGFRDVFVRDLWRGTNVLVSVNTNGVSGDGYSTDTAISSDGRYVAFTSFADDLVSGDTNRATDVFVRDLLAGTTKLVSINGFGTGPGNGASYSPVLSSNGQFVLFHSLANDLVPGMSSHNDNLFWRDLKNNLTFALTTNQPADVVKTVSMTPDGRWVALAKANTFNNPLSPPSALYIWDSESASIVYNLTGGVDSFGPLAISLDGQRLVYVTNAADTTRLVALDRTSNTNWFIASYQGTSTSPSRFSADSRFVAYVASLGSPASTKQVFLYDFQTGTNLLVSQSYDGVSPGNGDSDFVDISLNSRFVSYRSAANNLVPGDTNTVPNIFLYDRSNGTTTLITSSHSGGSVAGNRSLGPVFSGDGSTLVFESWAGNLIPNDLNHSLDVFALELPSSTAVPFTVSVVPTSDPAPSNWLSWPAVPGKTYHVQFKQNLNDATWLDLSGQISITGGQGSFKDQAASATQRFYRIVAF